MDAAAAGEKVPGAQLVQSLIWSRTVSVLEYLPGVHVPHAVEPGGGISGTMVRPGGRSAYLPFLLYCWCEHDW